eukprot:TRINITY_DN1361_c0_g1_i2.p2 TRINITY_DN1361_c0_g1~~TRINITY_DN1361_c0_g1_i2.p2  ORF type:complete len:210 (+),score=-18.99 TRINITY_DN1361_c0_g1_i2:258-887(+)
MVTTSAILSTFCSHILCILHIPDLFWFHGILLCAYFIVYKFDYVYMCCIVDILHGTIGILYIYFILRNKYRLELLEFQGKHPYFSKFQFLSRKNCMEICFELYYQGLAVFSLGIELAILILLLKLLDIQDQPVFPVLQLNQWILLVYFQKSQLKKIQGQALFQKFVYSYRALEISLSYPDFFLIKLVFLIYCYKLHFDSVDACTLIVLL